MVTAAIGAESFYTTENNAARTENLQQARDLDFKVKVTAAQPNETYLMCYYILGIECVGRSPSYSHCRQQHGL